MSEQDQEQHDADSPRLDRGVLLRLGYALGGVVVLALAVFLITLAFNNDPAKQAPPPNFAAAKRFSPEQQYDQRNFTPAQVHACRLIGGPVATALRLKREPGPGGRSCTWSYTDFDRNTHYTLNVRIDPSAGLPAGKTEKMGQHQAVRTKTGNPCTIAVGLAKNARIDFTVSGGADSCTRVDMAAQYLENFLPAAR